MHVANLLRKPFAIVVFILVAAFGADAFAQPTTWQGPKRRGRQYKVRIDSAPQMAAIYLEDEAHGIIGYTPWNGKLAKGDWNIILKKDGYKLGKRMIRVARSSRTQESFVPLVKEVVPAVLEVRGDADPNANGAKVWVDGQVQGDIPVTLQLDDGRHLVEVKKEGFVVFTQWIQVKEGDRQTVNPMLRAIEVQKVGSILIEADVPGAEVYLDGNKRPDTTPVIINDVAAGPHVVEVRKEPAMPWRQTITVEANKTVKVSAELKATMGGAGGNIRVLSSVEGAKVFLDGKEVGLAPIDIKQIAPGDHVVEVKLEGYETREERVTVAAGSAVVLKLDLRRGAAAAGALKIVSPVPEADVFVDGENIGKVPQARDVASGEHFVVVSKKGFKSFEQKIRVEPGKSLTITAVLKAVGAVRFLSNPSGAEVVLDGSPIGKTPMVSEEIAVGEHVVAIREKGYLSYETPLKVEGGKLKVVNATLEVEQTGPSAAELERRQRGLTSYGARTLPLGSSTIDVSTGYPYLLASKIMVGAGYLANRFGADAGFMFRSYFSQTELALIGRLTLVDESPFSIGTFATFGFASNFIDDSNRNSIFGDLGLAMSLSGLGAVTVTGRAYAAFYSDRHCPALNGAGTAYEDSSADGIELCDEYLAGTIDANTKMAVDQLLDGDGSVFDRDNNIRLMASLIVEVALQQRWNAWFLLEGAPFQAERAKYTDFFARPLLEKDIITYVSAGATYKF